MNTEAFFKISYGLYIVCSGNENEKAGYIANTAFQVTAEPPKIAISCNKDNYTTKILDKTGVYSISVLKQDASPEIIGLFGYKSGKETNKFKDTKVITGETGVPIVTEDCLAWFECKVTDTIDVGTHVIYVAEIINNGLLEDSDPLTYEYYRNVKKGKAPKNAPTYIAPVTGESESSGPETDNDLGPKYRCLVCDHIYDPAEGDPESNIPPGTPFEDLPENWMCPICGADKSDFVVIE